MRYLMSAALLALILGSMPDHASGQRVSVRSASVERMTLKPGERPVSVTLEGTGLTTVRSAAVEVRGRRTRDVRVTLGRAGRRGLPVSLSVPSGAPALEGELVLITSSGTLRTGVTVIVAAPDFTPVRFTTGQLRMTGWRFQLISFRTPSLTMTGWRFSPVSFRTNTLTMTGWRFQPVTIRTRPLTMIGHGSGRKEHP